MDVVFEINLVDGAQAERIGMQQAAVIRDVVLWHHQKSSSTPPHTSAPDCYNMKLASTIKHAT
ncbi:hypothetical protein ACQPW3_35615 [Actinosynnema sp. CA-248983]